MTMVARSHDIERFESAVRAREISPELILVDPELASVARASLTLHADKPAPVAGARSATAPEPSAAIPLYFPLPAPQFVHPTAAPTAERPLRGWEAVAATASHLFTLVTPALLFLSFLVNLALAGALLAGGGDAPQLGPPESAQPAVTQSPTSLGETPALVQTGAQPAGREAGRARTQLGAKANAKAGQARAKSGAKTKAKVRRARAQARARAKASAERTVLTLLQAAPKTRIAALIDSRTGLLKNNVQAVCRRRPARNVASFVCVIRVAGAPRGTGVYVRYSVNPGGGWSLTWLRHPKR